MTLLEEARELLPEIATTARQQGLLCEAEAAEIVAELVAKAIERERQAGCAK